MSESASLDLSDSIHLFQCPKCGGDLSLYEADLRCAECGEAFPIEDDIPRLFWSPETSGPDGEVVQTVKAFYEKTPFPDYDDFDDIASLAAKARRGIFARMLDEEIPPGARIIECGCGTGQLSNFLSIANRKVIAADMCLNSLRLGQNFARQHQLSRVRFVQMNLMRPAFKAESFDMVISIGVLMTTPDPVRAFETITKLVKPGGYILIGLYHRYGRLITDLRRIIFRLTGDRLLALDPNLRNKKLSAAKRNAWFEDQYRHPHEVKHTIGEVMGWFNDAGLTIIRSLPSTRLFASGSGPLKLFEPEEPGNSLERLLVELGMTFKGSREGGFFNLIGRKE